MNVSYTSAYDVIVCQNMPACAYYEAGTIRIDEFSFGRRGWFNFVRFRDSFV